MKRKIYKKLLDWKQQEKGRVAVLIDGARRVGKSYIVEEFAKREYKSYILLDFNKTSKDIRDLFDNYLSNLDMFFLLLQNITGVKLYDRDSLIIFDEIELYAHPEYQKNFINDFLNAINSINKNNDNINIIFITHSPFILSDIPKQNVLFLENGRSINYENKNTFGANITDLLADSFFINDGLIGDFAKEKISITLEWLKRKANEKRKKNNQKDLFKKENITVLEFENESEEIEYHKKIINLIDEPLVKNKLKEMFIEFVSEDLEFKDEQIRQLEEKLKKLKEK